MGCEACRMPQPVVEINALAVEGIDLIQKASTVDEAMSLFKEYGNQIKSLGGGLIWQCNKKGRETFSVKFPERDNVSVF